MTGRSCLGRNVRVFDGAAGGTGDLLRVPLLIPKHYESRLGTRHTCTVKRMAAATRPISASDNEKSPRHDKRQRIHLGRSNAPRAELGVSDGWPEDPRLAH